MLFFRRTCREVATLLVAREDKELSWNDRYALRLQLSACDTCPRFERQMMVMRQGFQRWRHYSDDAQQPSLDHPASK